MAEGGFRPPKQWQLTEVETITTFANWKSNILYHLSLCNEFAPFLEETSTWSKSAVPNRGLAATTEKTSATLPLIECWGSLHSLFHLYYGMTLSINLYHCHGYGNEYENIILSHSQR